jgi:hypothetical protein
MVALLVASQFSAHHTTSPLQEQTVRTPLNSAHGAPKPARRAIPSAPRRLRLVLAAARGDCWLSVHLGRQGGAVAWEGLLAQGRKLFFTSRRPLWIRVGAPQSLAVRVNGHRMGALPGGTPINVLAANGRLTVLSTG